MEEVEHHHGRKMIVMMVVLMMMMVALEVGVLLQLAEEEENMNEGLVTDQVKVESMMLLVSQLTQQE